MAKTLYKVTVWCCISGMCYECHARGNHGSRDGRRRRVLAADLTRERAERFLAGWAGQHEPKMEPMEPGPETPDAAPLRHPARDAFEAYYRKRFGPLFNSELVFEHGCYAQHRTQEHWGIFRAGYEAMTEGITP